MVTTEQIVRLMDCEWRQWKPMCPYSLLHDFDRWFQWQVAVNGPHSELVYWTPLSEGV